MELSEIVIHPVYEFMEIAVLLAGIGTLLKELCYAVVWVWKRTFHPGSETKITKKKESKMDNVTNASRVRQTLGIILIAGFCSMFALSFAEQNQQPLNIELTQAAWKAFEKNDFSEAISKAENCIKEFRGAADREQAKLEASKEPDPPTGSVSEEEKKKIMARGLLNDVATCFFIKGKSLEGLEKKDEARQAYQETAKYTYARCWDPKGWFWSPAETAQDRLTALK